MEKKTRLIILLVCAACFFLIAPVLVLYSEGYRFDIEKEKIFATGGIYVHTYPSADEITIDSNISEKPGFMENSIFVQSLTPKTHSVLVRKDGYYGYSKIVSVTENQVTKLENVILFKKDIKFSPLSETVKYPFAPENQVTENFIIKDNNLFINTPAVTGVKISVPVKKPVPVISNIMAFSVINDNIVWLGTDGFLYKSDSAGKNPDKLSLKAIKVYKKDSCKIINAGGIIFLNKNNELLIFKAKSGIFSEFASGVYDAKPSPDNKSLVFWNGNKISVHSFTDEKTGVLFTGKNISDIQWMNNDYIVFINDGKITISEIDFRDNVNYVSLPQTATLPDKSVIDIISPDIIFSQSSGQLYVLTNKKVFVSEKILP